MEVINTQIPKDWKFTSIETEIDLLTGFPFPSSGYTKAGIKLLRGSNVKRGVTDWSEEITQYWNKVTPELKQYMLREGDIVIAMDGSLVGRSFARLAAHDVPALLLQRVARVRSEKLDLGYLSAFICSEYFTKHCDSVKTASAIPHISPADIRKFSIPVPPTKAEQTLIAAALSDTDALIAGLEKLIAKKHLIKIGLSSELLSGKVRIEDFNDPWQNRSIYQLTTKFIDYRGRTPRKLGMEWGGGNIPALSANNVVAGGIDFSKECYLGSEALYKKWMQQGDCEKGDVLMTLEAPLGNVAQIPDRRKYILSQRVVLFKASNEVTPDFLFHLLSGIEFQNKIAKHASGSTAKGIQRKQLEQIDVRIPSSLTEQTAIADILNDFTKEIDALENLLRKSRDLRRGMSDSLLTGKIRLI